MARRTRLVDEYFNQHILFGGEAWRRIDVIKYLKPFGIVDGTPAYFGYMNSDVLTIVDRDANGEPIFARETAS